ncbi:TolC family protein [Synechococcus sp. UW140]|uniref:TolC family protein n=1 Tax=Synechococcus sp. UW140 TaxID=368503 RepID=UPI003137CCDB
MAITYVPILALCINSFFVINNTQTLLLTTNGMHINHKKDKAVNTTNNININKTDFLNNDLEEEARKLLAAINKKSFKISLDNAITRAVETNPKLVEAYRQIQAAEWIKVGEERGWLPKINLVGNPIYGRNNQLTTIKARADEIISGYNVKSLTNFTSANFFGPQISINWSFFDLARGPSIASKGNIVEQQKFLFDSIGRSIILDVNRAYYDLQATQILVDQYKSLFEISKTALISITAQQKAGLRDIGNVSQIATQYYTNLNSYYSSMSLLVTQGSALASLLNYSGEMIAITSDRMKPNLKWDLTLSESLSHGKNFNDEIMAASSNINAIRWEAKSLMNQYYPKLYLFGSGNLNQYAGIQSAYYGQSGAYNSRPGTYDAYNTENTQSVGQYGLGISWIFDGGISAAKSLSLSYKEQAAEAQYESVILNVTSKIKSAYGAFKILSPNIQSVNNGMVAAKLNQEVTQARYELGLTDVTSLVQSIQLYSSAVQQQVTTFRNLNTAVAELYKYTAIWPDNAVNAFKKRKSTLSTK